MKYDFCLSIIISFSFLLRNENYIYFISKKIKMDLDEIKCTVCLCPSKDYLGCIDRKCRVYICTDCFSDFLDHCNSESLPPECIALECSEWYLGSDIPRDSLNTYQDLIYQFYLRTDGSKAEQLITKGKMIQTLRKKRLSFLEANFTDPINLVVKLAFIKRLQQINNRRKIKEKAKYGRVCMNLICSGRLDSNLKCNMCQSQFCLKCEQLKRSNHQCKKEDLESIKAIKNTRVCPVCKITYGADTKKCTKCNLELAKLVVECPKCKTKISRHTGCNGMTCAVCGTIFDYKTGGKSLGGSFNPKVIKVNHNKLSGMYRNKLKGSLLNLVLDFESRIPPKKRYKTILTSLKKIKENKIELKKGKIELYRCVNRVKLGQYRYRNYIHVFTQLEQELRQNELDIDKIYTLVKLV